MLGLNALRPYVQEQKASRDAHAKPKKYVEVKMTLKGLAFVLKMFLHCKDSSP